VRLRRSLIWPLAVLIALLLHGGAWQVWHDLALEQVQPAAMQRLQASYTTMVALTAAPQAVSRPAAPSHRAAPRSTRPASGADDLDRVEIAATPPVVAVALPASESLVPLPPVEPASPVSAPAAVEPVASAASTPVEPPDVPASAPRAFTWPPSTRLNYRLIGNYRGQVDGSAQVEWLHQGERYQVHLDIAIGPSFAPLVSRRTSSEGRLNATGLVPQLYEQETRALLASPRRAVVRFDERETLLANGKRVQTPADVQDVASQFIQLIYLYTTRPELRQRGQTVEFGLALPNRIDRWSYEAGDVSPQQTAAGTIEALHVKPRRAADPGDITVEMWLAPRLQWLPVRIRMQQDAETYLDLTLERLPEQASP
jgi:hypothetical protein